MNASAGSVALSDVPHLPQSRERFIRAFGIFSLLVSVMWLYWRWNYTLNPDAYWFSLALVSAETWGLLTSALFLFGAWRIPPFESPAATEGRSVDVFITTYDEPIEVLRRTAIGAAAIRYPHRTYILDDGKRDEVRALAADLGIGYIRRPDNSNAKAGNLNFALGVTCGEFVLQLDTDHVPLPHIIDRLIGYFDDPEIAFVQTPQDFYNTDSFTHVVNENARSFWEENRIFYSLLQPGKDAWNASFFCGSCGMLRRSAIASIGGFSTRTIIEDMETSLILHSKGWRSRYHQEALAFGLSPGSASSFQVQRLRWAQGSMQILRKLNPLFLPGLQTGQRISYVSACLYPFDGWQKIVFYGSPVLFLLTGWVPIRADTTVLMSLLIPYLLITIGSFELTARGTGYVLIAERYNVAKFWTYLVSSLTIFTNRKLKFNVTPKGVSKAPLSTYLPQLVLLAVSGVAILWAPFAFYYGWVDYNVESFDLAFLVSLIWVLSNIYFAQSVVRMSRGVQQQRSDHRFNEDRAIQLQLLDREQPQAWPSDLVVMTDLNPTGLAFRASFEVPTGTVVRAALPLTTGVVDVTGVVIHAREEQHRHGRVHVHGVEFKDLSPAESDLIELHCTQHTILAWRMRYRQSLDIVAWAGEMFRNARRGQRSAVMLPARVWSADADGGEDRLAAGLLEELSPRGARLLLDRHIPAPTHIRFDVPGTNITGHGRVVFTRAFETPMSRNFSIGLELDGVAFGDTEPPLQIMAAG